ncbi:hypothetical protein [Nocardia lasii]|uniref:Uncharacterized protein n=1 Tax=Nocardia lasii TaxID=1616107 RepID=A0ABW1JV15_9NOCA
MLIFLIPLSLDVPDAWAAHTGDGRLGTWTMTERACRPDLCITWGDFVPDDGGPGRDRIHVAGGDFRSFDLGSRHRTIDVGASDTVFVPGGGRASTTVRLFTIMLPLVGLWCASVAFALRHRLARTKPPNHNIDQHFAAFRAPTESSPPEQLSPQGDRTREGS